AEEFTPREIAILFKQLSDNTVKSIKNKLNKDLKIKVEKELAKTMRPRKETINKILNKFNDLIK
ncbi:MAG: hypothetical protein PHT45_05600, partial [Bacteroidales bacterium]|nr:hypothetical protein [Bacteroidales bacterium]